ncbi:MAG: reverse transcriptase family protein [Solirubrobacteraceae bacterium]
MSSSRAEIAKAMSSAFLAGPWEPDAMAARALHVLDNTRLRWPRRVAAAIHQALPRPPLDAPRMLAVLVERELPAAARAVVVRRWMPFEPAMGRTPWPVLKLDSPADLAQRLELDVGQLVWLADARSLERTVTATRLRNYRYRWRTRVGALPRLIEQPKARLMESQRIVLREILDAIPPHDAAHGFRSGRSVRTHAEAHVGAVVVMRFDLEDFFASVGPGRVWAIFRAAGYPESVAHALTALCTNVVPQDEWASLPAPDGPITAIARHRRLGRRLATPHLPQGAPTSPALANLAAFALDVRLSAYAQTFGARYTRYADDLAFSGDRRLSRAAQPLRRAVAAIARDEGFALHPDKSQLMTRAGRQVLCSVVVNQRLNVPREEYDRLKAILHDARHDGLDAANRDGVPEFRAHLEGRIAWIASLNPDRGRRLRERLAAVA